ncbi:autotransporter outer membrane beta-barrel domain-containing protein [Rickettsia rickettsii str. 'Sheila Smith']|uniref:190-kDa cell surface antigen n=2 Tax=Rickettsia rickettsii TaxID=783 RepID=A0A0H3AYB5_RICRS|nr:autotransporter outer membrane beta-barrel domain-containing protein [Rickettsia rickettsii]ABV76839.1 190-KDa cell surface antigen [Rickettsia rickettsii str. 'Sheila Smith']WGQ95415.1 autotransporter outer membrane beta-barrel domain-containing protein [Rickettsia rickettsii str. 'Sheila Smith']
MANISPKLFKKAIQQGLKAALFTTSTAAIMLSSSGALGVATGVIATNNNAAFSNNVGNNNWNEITAAGVANGTPAGGPQNNWAFTYGGDYTVTADAADRIIKAINVAGTTPVGLNITQNTVVGSIITKGNLLPVTLNAGKSLTLNGNNAVAANHGFDAPADNYTGLGNIALGGANAALIIQSAAPSKITLAGNIDGGGIITVKTDAAINGTIGNTNALATVNVGAGTATLGGAVIKATTTKLTNAASVLTLTNANAVLTGAIDNTTGGDNVGVLNLNGALSQVTGDIGNTNSLATISVGAGTATLGGAVIKATTTKLTDAASAVKFTNPVVVTGAIDNTGNANNGIVTFTGNSTVTGNVGNTNALATVNVGAGLLQVQGGVVKANTINLTDNASAVTFTNPVVVTGAIDNTGNANNGIVTFTGNSTVTGDIGNTNALATVNVGAGTATLGGAVIKATTTKLTNAASVLTLTNANAVLTGAIDNTTGGDNVGVLNLNGALSQVTGNIGNTNSLATISVGAGTATLGGAVIKATTTKLTDAASAVKFTNPVVVTGAIDNTGNANNGIVTFTGNSTVTGDIGNTNSLATISVGAGTATLGGAVIKATTTKLTNAASVLTLTNANAVLTGAIDNTTGGDNVGVLNLNGALSQVTGDIGNTNALATVNVGAGTATLGGAVIKATTTKLTNAVSAVKFTNPVVVTGAIDNTGNANNGIVTFTGNSTVTGDIGNTNALATVNVGAGTATLGGAVIKATTTKLTNAASVLTLTNANAVLTGAIDNTTGGDNVGVLNLNGALSQVTGDIGNTNSLATISVGAGTATLGGAVIKATTTKLTNAASVLTLTNANAVLTGAIDNTTGGDNVGVLNLNGALSQVTGDIGNTNSLATISVGAGTATLGGAVIKATTTKLTNAASVLTLTNANAVLTGAIDNTTGGDNVGVLNLNGALSQVTGDIGNTNSLATISVGAGTATLGGAVIKATTTKLTDAASAVKFTNPVVVTGAIDNTGNANNGIVTFTGNSTVTGNVGNTNALATVNVGAGLLQVQGGVVKANTINLTDNASAVTFTNPVVVTGAIDNTGNANNGIVTFTGNSTVTGNVGNTNALATVNVGAGLLQVQGGVVKANTINLTDNASAVTFTNPVVVTGAIDNTGNANNGIVTFTGNSTVTGDIGNTNALATVNVGAGITLQAGGSLAANNIDFGARSTLEFNGPLDGGGKAIPYYFKGAIANGNNAILNVNTKLLTASHLTIGTVAEINIGAGNLFTIDASVGDVTILNAQNINFRARDSVLVLSNLTGVGVNNILLAADLVAPGADEGTVVFNGGVNGLNIGSNVAGTARNIGDGGGNKFNTLLIYNAVTITDDVNLEGIQNVLINNNADFTSSTAFNAGAIQINDATYTIDANNGNLNIPAGNIQFAHADAQLVLQNSSGNDRTITLGANIDPDNDDEGIVILNSVTAGKKLTIAGGKTFGGAHKLQTILFKGAGDCSTAGTTFNTTNIVLDITGQLELGATTANVVLFNDAVQLTQTGNIGGFLDFNAKNGMVTLNNNVNVAGAVQNTGGTNNGTLIVLGASNLNRVNGIAMLKVGAGNVTIAKGGKVKIGEIQGTGTNTLTLPAHFNLTGSINKTGGQALKLNFMNGGSVSGVVGTAANSVGDITTAGATSFASSVNAKGTATLGGTTSFANTFTNTGAVTLAKGSITSFAKNVTATSFVANSATINFSNSLAFNSNITGGGTTLTLGANQVTYTGTGSFTDTLTLNTTFDGAAKSGGNILIKSGSTLDLSGVSTLALVVTATNFDMNNISPDTKYTVISAETAGGLKPTSKENVKITINNDNRFVDFTFDASTLTLFAEDIAADVIDGDFAPGGPLANIPNAANIKKSLELMEDAPNGSDARQAFNNFGLMTPLQEADATTHLIQDVVKPSDTIAAVNNQVVASNISSNITALNARMDKVQSGNKGPVSSGDEDMDAKFGAWISPFVGNATQKMCNSISGYKSDTTGGTIGFDGFVSDDLALGLAYTRADTDIKLKNNKTGDKNKVESNIYSLYGLYNVPYENLFVEAIASYSDNKIRSKSRRVIATTLETVGYQTANGKYKSESYTGQLMAGYTYMMPENINLTPLAGLRYSTIKDKGYKETGTTYQNLTVKGKNYNTFDGLLGAKVSSNINVNEIVLTPELYAMVDYAFKNKVSAIDARLQGMTAPLPTNSFKQSKTSFDVGVGVTAKHKMMEYRINYDTNIGSKYFAQQGSVKVRVNF